MWSWGKHSGLFASLFFLSACGFNPMLADSSVSGGAVPAALAQVYVEPLNDRLGQMVRNGLLDRLNPMGEPNAPDYSLAITLHEATEGFGFRADESVTRMNYRLTADYVLRDAVSGDVLTQGQARSNMAFDVVQSDFANVSAEEDARRRTGEQVVGILVTRLAVYFNSADQE